jgi:histidine phosphotransfer protein HptB
MVPLYSSLGGDPDLGDLVTLFVEEMTDRVAHLYDLYNRKDWEELRRSAHQLKGAAGSYGFGAISPYAGKLETAIRDTVGEDEILLAVNELADICKSVHAGVPNTSNSTACVE